MKKLNKLLEGLILVLPAVLFFSYFPVIGLGTNESMNFEFSLPLIWLVIFDVVGLVAMWKRRILIKGLKGKWMWLLFPVWISLSVLWSLNFVRGLLTVGIVWLLYLAGYMMWSLKDLFDQGFRAKFLKWLFGFTLVVCGWCLLQCVLDILGVSQGWTLLCDGCTYHMFGFPHPNGFAIEPQFMGNLLLAPTLIAAWLILIKQSSKNTERERSRGDNFHNKSVGVRTKLQFRDSLRDCCKNYAGSRSLCPVFLLLCFIINTTTLFVTFSRGALYAFIVALVFIVAFVIAREKAKRRREVVKHAGVVCGAVILSFLFALNAQGLLAQFSPTEDTYSTGVAKVLHHLSLGVIDVRDNDFSKSEPAVVEKESEEEQVVENSVEKSGNNREESLNENSTEEAAFDGYVAESTDTRLRLTSAAVKVWSSDAKTVLFGVGLGGAGQALYNNDLSPAPKEIIQNEYASLLLETGLIGISLLALTLLLIIRTLIRNPANAVLLSLIVAYGISLLFFSGLPNALQIYLIPMVICMIYWSDKRKKLVS